MNRLLTLAIFTGLVFMASPVQAQMLLGEGKVSLSISGGDRINKSLTVYNNSAETFSVRAYWEDFEYQSPYDGQKLFLPAGTGKNSASQWITFSPQEFSLPAFGKQVIDYSFNIPNGINAGYYGVLFFERNVATPQGEFSGVNIVTRVGCLFFLEPKDKIKKAAMQDLAIAGNTLTGKFINQGNVVIIPRITYYGIDKEGMASDRGEIKKLYVPAEVSALWSMHLPPELKAGSYTYVINTDMQEGDVVVKEVELTTDGFGHFSIQNVRD